MQTLITRAEALLIVITEFVTLSIFKMRVKDKFFKKFARNRQEGH